MGRLRTTVAVAVALLAVAGGVTLAAGGLTGTPTPATDTAEPTQTDAATVTQDDAMASDSPMARLACTNGTSEAVVACGYSDMPTAVSLGDQQVRGNSLTVEAVELNEGGFVAVHRLSYVNGAFTESVVGVSTNLSAGLHRDVPVALDEPVATEDHLLAVVYRDSDSDGSFDFVSSDGMTDRPYTNTYTESGGNVTDEPGDVIGDVAAVTVKAAPAIGANPATNIDDDAMLEDVDGNGEAQMADLIVYFNARNSAAVQNNPALFDFDGDGEAGTIADVIALFNEISA